MTKIITATNNPNLNEELKKEKNVQVLFKDIFYKEGILEILEKDIEIDYIIIDENLSGEIELNNLIEKILEKNKNIKIIITIKKENKNKININNKKIIKIFYEGKINLQKIKKNNKNYKEMNRKNKNDFQEKISSLKNMKENYFIKPKEKNENGKIISVFGERQVGKSIFIINLAYYLKGKHCKILLVDLNQENPSLFSSFGCKKFNKIRLKKRKKVKKKQAQISKRFLVKYVNRKVLEKKIVRVNRNIDLLSYTKIINFNFIEKVKKNYDYLIIENHLKKNKKLNKKIIKNSYKNILIIKPNLQGIKNSKKIIEKIKLNNNFKIIINDVNKYSIDEKIIKNIFGYFKIIGEIKHKNIYDDLINKNFKNIKYKYLKREFERIGEQL